jgi:hypothetical protein
VKPPERKLVKNDERMPFLQWEKAKMSRKMIIVLENG